ncbi:MAG TPA: hypothetical protein VNQ73_20490 [Ilumatobacter sp.]|nr:hypothetical protein [Ilumatobacter sp.]
MTNSAITHYNALDLRADRLRTRRPLLRRFARAHRLAPESPR